MVLRKGEDSIGSVGAVMELKEPTLHTFTSCLEHGLKGML